MKGHMEDGKFHPHKQYKGKSRKKRLDYNDPELVANAGVKIENGNVIRKARAVTKPKPLPDVFSRSENFSFTSDEGDIHLSLDDFGWRWSGDEDQLNGFMVRMSGTGSQAWDKLVSDLKDAGITVDMLKPHLLKNLSGKLTPENDDGMYEISGDNSRWKFGDEFEVEGAIEGEFEHFNQEGELLDDEQEEFENEFWNHFKAPTYERWLEAKGNGYREQLKDLIKNATDYDDLDLAYIEVHNDIQEMYHEFFHNESVGVASWDAVEAIQARRNQEGQQK